MSHADTQQALANVLRHPAIWRAEQVTHVTPGIPTAYPALDQALPEHGWPAGALTELLVKGAGAGELSLLVPALRAICTEGRGIALVAPPWLPHARAWEAAGIQLERMLIVDGDGIDLLWAAEQILRSGECGAILVWGQAAGRALNNRALQRLHLAASTGNAACFLYRSVAAEANPSPAPLRIRLGTDAGSLQIQIVKCRGAAPAKPVRVQLFPAHWYTAPAPAAVKTPRVAAVPSSAAKTAAEASYVAGTGNLDPLAAKTSTGKLRVRNSPHRNITPANSSSAPLSVPDAVHRLARAAPASETPSVADAPQPFLIPVQTDLV